MKPYVLYFLLAIALDNVDLPPDADPLTAARWVAHLAMSVYCVYAAWRELKKAHKS